VYVVVVVANVVVNVENVSNLQWLPSNIHTHPLQSANVPHPLETLCHVPFYHLGSTPTILLMAMSYMVSLTFVPSTIFHVEMSSMVLL
jgi:hypothetical protein